MARAIYTSHPVARLRIGGFKFENGTLDFNKPEYTDEDESKFKKLYESLPPAEKNRIKLIDVDLATELSKRILAMQPMVTRTVDSSHGRPDHEIG